jgi:hypothetical protein
MTTIITTPSGKEIRIDGTRVCASTSPEKCWEEDPGIIQMRISHARRNYDKGYRVIMPTFMERFRKLRAKLEEKHETR